MAANRVSPTFRHAGPIGPPVRLSSPLDDRERASHNDDRGEGVARARRSCRESCYGRSAARTQHAARQNGHLRNAQSTRRSRTHAARVDTRRMATRYRVLPLPLPPRDVARGEKSRDFFPSAAALAVLARKKKKARSKTDSFLVAASSPARSGFGDTRVWGKTWAAARDRNIRESTFSSRKRQHVTKADWPAVFVDRCVPRTVITKTATNGGQETFVSRVLIGATISILHLMISISIV